MRDAALLLKADVQAGKQLLIVDQFVLKLPDVDSHRYHVTEGEVENKIAYLERELFQCHYLLKIYLITSLFKN